MSRKKEEEGEFTLTADILVLDEIAKSLKEVSHAFRKINNGPLRRRAVILLIHDQVGAAGPNKTQINQVLTAAASLDQYLKQLE